jgi:Phage terminase large subunit gpA, ATPase domain
MQTKLNFKMSDFVQKFFYLDYKPFSLTDYPHMRLIYDMDPWSLVLNTSRQVSKSVTVANLLLARALVLPYSNEIFYGGFKALFVAPTIEQVRAFSYDRVDSRIEQSPVFKRYFMSGSTIQNVFQKRFLNGSVLYLRYGATSAERIRGLSADFNVFDEAQDIPEDNMEIASMTMARSHYKHRVYSGTPKHIIGPLASKWKESTKNEWIAKCSHCGKYNYLDEQNIQPFGLGCRYCHLSLDARNGQWVRTNSESLVSETNGEFISEGFRISVLMFAHASWVDWQRDVYLPFLQKPRAIFFNEYLGLAYDAGVSPITEEEIKACCTGGPMRNEPDTYSRDYPTFMGIDWGPINSDQSKTLATIMQRRGEKLEVLYLKKFLGKEADYSALHESIPSLFYKWGCRLIGADAGFGEAVNSEIRARLKDFRRLLAFQHVPNQKAKAQWNEHIQAYTLSRNTVMTDLFMKIKARKIVFPRWEDFKPFAQDILAIAMEYNEEKNTFKYIKSGPDDVFHSLLYGDLAAELFTATNRTGNFMH